MNAVGAAAPADLFITPELHRRLPKVADHLSEKLALQGIAAQIIDHPEQVLPKLVERAMEMTGAVSAGISAFEPEPGTDGVFRWRDLRGELARFEGATTPRNYSPCGVCLDRLEPTLTRRPERHYTWIAEAGVHCPEVLLVPLYVAQDQPLGTLWIVSEREGYFDSGHARVMRELATFTGIALAMQRNQQQLQDAVAQQETLAAEMSHRVKNLFALIGAIIRVSQRSATSPAEMASVLSGRLHALAAAHALARPSFEAGLGEPLHLTASLEGLILAILKPYDLEGAARFAVEGPEIALGSQAATALALVFHELATNAAKYGALMGDEGRVAVRWRRTGNIVALQWLESGGPAIAAEPDRPGFGSSLVRDTITRQLEGTFSLDWGERGLVAEFVVPVGKLTQ